MKRIILFTLLILSLALVALPRHAARADQLCECDCIVQIGVDPTEINLCDLNPADCRGSGRGPTRDIADLRCNARCDEIVERLRAERPDVNFVESNNYSCSAGEAPGEGLAPAGQACQCSCDYADGSGEGVPGLVDGGEAACQRACSEQAPVNADGSRVAVAGASCVFVARPAADADAGKAEEKIGSAKYEAGDVAIDLSRENPLGTTSVPELAGRIIKVMVGLSGSLALLMFVYGGFLWMTAAGNEDRVKSGKNTLLWASLGIVAMFLSYSAVSLVLKTIGG